MIIEEFLWYYILFVILGTAAVSLYGIVYRPHMIKKLIMLTIYSDAIEMLAVLLGYRVLATQPPVFPGGVLEGFTFPTATELENFASSAVDPIPQVLIVTAIVIGMAVTLFLVAISVRAAELFGTQNLSKLEAGEG